MLFDLIILSGVMSMFGIMIYGAEKSISQSMPAKRKKLIINRYVRINHYVQ